MDDKDELSKYGNMLLKEVKMTPLISVLIPTYNHADYLPAALESILAQTYENWEAIIVNDGSTDDTDKIIKKFVIQDGRFRTVSKPNGGTASALNEGLKNARGEWICWLSSDDLFEPYKLEVHVDAIKRTPDGHFFHSGFSHLDNASGDKKGQPIFGTIDQDIQVLNFFRSCWVHANSFAAHRSVFEHVGGFTQGVYHFAQDFDMWMRISTKYRLHYIPERTCISRMHPAQPTTEFFEAGKLDCVHACYDFLNLHTFAGLFPFLDLNNPDSARKAIYETIRVYLHPSAYFHTAGYNPALLERMYEWLENSSSEQYKTELICYCNDLLRQVMELDISKEAREFIKIFSNRSKENFKYSPHDFFKHILQISNSDDDSNRIMKRYIAEHMLFEAAKDKLRINDTDTALVLLEHAYRILPSSSKVKEKLTDTIRRPEPTSLDADIKKVKKPLRILLINPPYRRFLGLSNNTFPITFGSMSTMLKNAGFEVAIYDADFDRKLLHNSYSYSEMFTMQHLVKQGLENTAHPVWMEIEQVIADFSPDVIGITAMTPKYPIVERIVALIKGLDPQIMTVVGGHHPTIFGEQALRNHDIDCVVVGEGELTFFELMQAVAQNEKNWNQIAGIIFRNHKGDFIQTAARKPIEDLDMLPIPDRDLILNDGYVSDNNIITTRGCPFNCTYCGAKVIWGHKQRRRSVHNIIKEVRYLVKRSGSRCISFWDDSFTCNKKHTHDLMNALANISGLRFSCLTRINLIDEEILSALKMAGCNNILFGIESGSDRILKLMQKGTTRKMIRKTTSMVAAKGISWLGFFIMGYPGETKDDIIATLEFMKELNPPYAEINIFNPLPGTQTWNDLEKDGKQMENMDFSRHSQASTDNLFIDMSKECFRELSFYIASEFDAHNAGSSVINRSEI